MSNSISVQLTTTNTIDNIRNVISNNQSLATTSSNVLVASQAVTSSAWTQLSLGSLTDIINVTLWADNTNYTSSTIAIASGSAGQNVFTILIPDSAATIPWSGSLGGLYAKVVSGYPVGTATPPNGVVQYSVQQS